MASMPWLLTPVGIVLSMLTNNTSISTTMDGLKKEQGNSTFTDSSPRKVLPRLLDYFVPGYGLISHHVSEELGIDIDWLLFIWLSIYVLKWLIYIVCTAVDPVLKIFTTECQFIESGRLYQIFLCWAQDRGIGLNNRLTRADIEEVIIDMSDALNNFDPVQGVSLRQPPWILSLKPAYGAHWFFYKGHLFRFYHQLGNEANYPHKSRIKSSFSATLSCISFSQQPLKDLLNDVLRRDYRSKKFKTNIWSPSYNKWDLISSRTSRSISTVVLDAGIKSKILSDIVEFLKNKTQQWYIDRGLPYRRGYLFCGPPGTGKSSLAFVIAGMFDIGVYNLSIQDPDVTDQSLMRLFNQLPDKCVVLMEDIDSAGIQNRGHSITVAGAQEKLFQLPKTGHTSVCDTRVTLAGLLNVIDGIASKDGRILIMTTNKVDSLDPALIRPGRIDMIIEFGLLSKKHTQELFVLMYKTSKIETIKPNSISKQLASNTLENIATKFAEYIPEGKFSPAEVQGYLICHKGNPEAALADVESWVTELLKKKYGETNNKDHRVSGLFKQGNDQVAIKDRIFF